ncbi:unnamed protein product [Symbiodinium sp. CCMP2592]|nr:unnamed protein product [Symbiodinium sp. CCMP2592]
MTDPLWGPYQVLALGHVQSQAGVRQPLQLEAADLVGALMHDPLPELHMLLVKQGEWPCSFAAAVHGKSPCFTRSMCNSGSGSCIRAPTRSAACLLRLPFLEAGKPRSLGVRPTEASSCSG